MSEKRRALGRGLGALIPGSHAGEPPRPVDVFFRDRPAVATDLADPHRADPDPGGGAARDAEAPGTVAGAVAGRRNGDAAGPVGAGRTWIGHPGDRDLAPVPGATFAELPVGEIRANPRQPRTAFDEDELAELAYSIREIGVLQPVVVRRVPAGPGGSEGSEGLEGSEGSEGSAVVRYELVMGERRWRASQRAGLERIPAIIKDTTDDHLLRDALLENLHRSQLNALEEAAAYQQLLDDFGCSHEELATRLGRSRPQISNTLRLLKLPPLVARRLAAGVLSAGHARALLGLEDGAAIERLAQRIVAEGMSVRNVEEAVALGGEPVARGRRPRAGTRHPQLDDLAASLSEHLDTRVHITLGQRKGRFTVEFASVDDLTRIVDLLGLGAARATADA